MYNISSTQSEKLAARGQQNDPGNKYFVPGNFGFKALKTITKCEDDNPSRNFYPS